MKIPDGHVWEFQIIGKPVSQKNAKRVGVSRGRAYMYTPKDIKRWHESAERQLRAQVIEQEDAGKYYDIPEKTELEVKIISYLDKGQAIDVDNLAAAPLDAMQKAGIYNNDYWVRCVISARKKDWINPRVEIKIREYRESYD